MSMCRPVVLVALAACGSDPAPRPMTFGGDRPTQLQVPASFDPTKTYPLLVVLHGYGASGFVQESYFGLKALPDAGQAFVLAPDGLIDSMDHPFWNADPACCDYDMTHPDDVGYLGGLIDSVSAAWPVDPGAVLVLGHSNGAYMAYRMACDRADVVTNIIAVAGAAASDAATCVPHQPVEVLHIHGTTDTEVPYVPIANDSVAQWVEHDGCAATRTAGPDLDLDYSIAGAETHTATADGCPAGIAVELWTMEGASHLPNLDASFAPRMFQYLLAHRR